MNASFVAMEVETGNADRSNICQIGAILVENGTFTDTFKTLLDYKRCLDPGNLSIHGVTGKVVEALQSDAARGISGERRRIALSPRPRLSPITSSSKAGRPHD